MADSVPYTSKPILTGYEALWKKILRLVSVNLGDSVPQPQAFSSHADSLPQMFLQALLKCLGKRYHPMFATFSIMNRYRALSKIDILDTQAQSLALAQSTAIQKLCDQFPRIPKETDDLFTSSRVITVGGRRCPFHAGLKSSSNSSTPCTFLPRKARALSACFWVEGETCLSKARYSIENSTIMT